MTKLYRLCPKSLFPKAPKLLSHFFCRYKSHNNVLKLYFSPYRYIFSYAHYLYAQFWGHETLAGVCAHRHMVYFRHDTQIYCTKARYAVV